MRELQQILAIAGDLKARNKPFALATVVRIGGSTYRRPGARMLVTEEGDRWGTISGGCLEGEVASQALDILSSKKAQLIPFNLQDDDIILGFGTGCNGVVHVLIQPVYPDDPVSPIDALQHCLDHRVRGVLATVIQSHDEQSSLTGQFTLLDEQQSVTYSTLNEDHQQNIRPEAHRLLDEELQQEHTYLWHTATVQIGETSHDLLYEVVRPPISLYIFGEGHDVHAMIDQASIMGWNTHIIGRKPVDVLEERFPKATTCQFLMHPEEAASRVHVDARSAALVMNHSYQRDKAVVHAMLSSSMPYVGVLGPRERTEGILIELENEGLSLTEDVVARLFGPVGLDIGTETPEEIALSSIAEVQSVIHNRNGASLRKREGPIHAQRTPIDVLS